ncbi:uncharacterized protein LOC113501677 [Trichoplusia ni]|uniref:Uncharacterized protein LOC113501677 n=1 Tax=Trichoplusia ni TaxID=7111 RepID=A0A7E5WEU0_TRINI|nr:uncharacterized protein LOC113501677 [Trichoplusia ni]
MARNKLTSIRLGQSIAEEKQLLAEEKWIIEILADINRNKNSLQIERLHFEHVKSQILKGNKTDPTDLNLLTNLDKNEALPSQIGIQELAEKLSDKNFWSEQPLNISGYEVAAGLDEVACNNEKLNLSMTTSVFANRDLDSYDMEEEEDDEEEEDVGLDNCEIDMNMFMHGDP